MNAPLSTDRRSQGLNVQPECWYIRGDVPEIGCASLMVTRSPTEAALWRSQGHVVSQAFHFTVRTAYG